MTDEQKAVDEMAENQNVKNIQNIINNAIANNHGIINYKGMSVIYCAIDLHKAHYRPEAEVRAQAVKEFAEKVIDGIFSHSGIAQDCSKVLASPEILQDEINEVAEQFGKEADNG